jgi:hypothetical protein
MRTKPSEKRNRVLQALAKSDYMTWNQLVEETKLPTYTLSRYLKQLVSENIVFYEPAVYSLTGGARLLMPTRPMTIPNIVLARGVKRLKARKIRISPLKIATATEKEEQS